jgi:ketosteroid isomerase-like protein
MKNIIVPVVSMLLATTAVVGNEKKNEPESSKLKVVQEFVAAFNSHDVDGMMKLVSEDVEWLNIKGNEVDLQTVGRSATRAAMKGYFSSTPTTKCASSRVVLNFREIIQHGHQYFLHDVLGLT